MYVTITPVQNPKMNISDQITLCEIFSNGQRWFIKHTFVNFIGIYTLDGEPHHVHKVYRQKVSQIHGRISERIQWNNMSTEYE